MHNIYIILTILSFWIVGLNLTVFIFSLLIKRIHISVYDFFVGNIVGILWPFIVIGILLSFPYLKRKFNL